MCGRGLNSVTYFNSRPCARGDSIGGEAGQLFDISIPAPARGATMRTTRMRRWI